jgi:hypothetical protein
MLDYLVRQKITDLKKEMWSMSRINMTRKQERVLDALEQQLILLKNLLRRAENVQP